MPQHKSMRKHNLRKLAKIKGINNMLAYTLTLEADEKPPRGYQNVKARADIWGNVNSNTYF